MYKSRPSALVFAGFAALTLMAGCAGNAPAVPVISVSVSPTVATLIGGATQTLVATVTNDSANAGVSWTASTGAVTAAGVYTAPTPVTTTTATVTATSKTDTTKSATATITLTPISVSVAPTTTTLAAGATQTFVATVTSDQVSAGVTWTASAGTITTAGVYTAPTPVTTATATVTATSKTDTTKTATATVTLTPIAVSVAPTTATLAAGATQTFAATVTGDATLNQGVTWTASAGTITTAGVYAAPTPVTSATATVTATSKTDATKTGTATVTLTPIAVSVSPTTATLIGGATQTFIPTVTGDATLNQGVIWMASTGTITAGGVYTAPALVTTASATVTATSKTDATKSGTATVTLTPISVNAISPATVSLGSSGSQAFTDTVANDGSSSGVSWSIGSGVGTLTATTTTGVTYNAPTTVISAVTTVTLTATSIKDPTKSTTATITLNSVSVTISPTSPAAMIGGATQLFTATVVNDGSNSGVNWTFTGGGSLSAGSTLSGVATTFTSANPVIAATATVTATSIKDPSKSASATITLTPISFALTSASAITVDAGQQSTISATIANDGSASGASFVVSGAGGGTMGSSPVAGNSPSSTYSAPGSLVSSTSSTITVASVTDPTKRQIVAVTLNPAMAFTPAPGALAGGLTGTVYAGATVSATGGSGTKTYSLASGALPLGLSISPSTGAISGTATGTAGTSTFTVKVTDSASAPATVTSGTYTIAIAPQPLQWVSPTTGTLTYTVGTAITPIGLSTTGGTGTITYSVNSGVLPQGLQIVGNQVTGTPTAPTIVGGNVVSFLATDSATPTPVTAISPSVTFIVNPVTLTVTSASLPTGVVNVPYSYQLNSTGGTGAITWSLSSGSLTGTGLSLSSTGLISGTPTTTQSALNLTFQAQDSAINQQQTVTKSLPLTVTNALTITTNNSSLPLAYTGQSYPTTTLVAAGGTGPYTWSVTSGLTGTNSLATLNLSVSGSGVITGTPAAAGTANFTVQVKDSASQTSSMSYTVTAYTPLSLPTPNPTSLPSATTTVAYVGSVSAGGGVAPYTWTVNGSAVPTNNSSVSLLNGVGLSIANNGNGVLNVTGTPTGPGTVTFTASITDNAGTTVGPTTYSISVSTTHNVSGQVYSTVSCSGGGLSGITVSINTSPVQSLTTDSNGNFSFLNVPNGTYTLTPSITGPSSVFSPATQSVTVNNGNSSSTPFGATLGYTVSGTVAYAGTQTGQIYLSLPSTTCGGGGSQGTSISAKGAFTIRGVPPGTYSLQTFMDNQGRGVPNAANPAGSTSGVTVGLANLTGVSVTLIDPASVNITTAPTIQGINGFNTGALIQFKPVKNSSNVETATSYTLQWSTTSAFTAVAGSKTFLATGTKGQAWFLNGLTDGSIYYFRASATSGGTPTGPNSAVYGPVTIGAPTGSNTVSGSVTFTGTATGPLYVGFYNQNTSTFYGQYIASPVSAQAFSVLIPSSSSYQFVGFIDQNKDGVLDAGDISNIGDSSNNANIAITGSTANQNLTLPNANGVAVVTTQNYKQMNSGGTSQSYSVNFRVSGLTKQPVAVTLISGPNVISPVDIALCNGGNNSCGQGFQISFNTGATSPTVGDTYTFTVTYGDTTTGTLTAQVTAVLTTFATNLAPTTGTSVSTTPTFTWTDPICSACSAYTYSFSINDSSGNTVWQIPGNNSNTNAFSSSITSIVWGTDPTGGGSTASVSSLSTSTVYNWQIQISDSNGNQATAQVNYQP